jgi:hypothetical protein
MHFCTVFLSGHHFGDIFHNDLKNEAQKCASALFALSACDAERDHSFLRIIISAGRSMLGV